MGIACLAIYDYKNDKELKKHGFSNNRKYGK